MSLTSKKIRNPLQRKHLITSPILRLLLFYFCSLLIAAIATPLIFNCVVNWHKQSPDALNTYLIRKGFVVFFDRIRLIALFFFFPALWKIYRQEINSLPDYPNRKVFCPFFIHGIWFVVGIFGAKMLFLDFTWETPSLFFLTKALLGALLIALLEEWLFRGFIFRFLLDKMRPVLAFTASAFIFAYLHFRPTYSLFVTQEPTTFSNGFYCLYELIFHSLVGISWFKFLIIFSLGYLLASVYFYTQKLTAAIGLHAGVIFPLTIFKNCAIFPVTRPIFGSNDLFDSPLALFLIILAAILSRQIRYE
ncbi:MAG: CPBP family intramembrane metalloprotease [Puniceicoccales bacterium]|jgi:membrane protease YdiL (CAAX protease family)|nr:CPBP family intramembrane metalloprotease [Puniceicoccales bacterium]